MGVGHWWGVEVGSVGTQDGGGAALAMFPLIYIDLTDGLRDGIVFDEVDKGTSSTGHGWAAEDVA